MVENYKTILKSVNQLQEMIDEALKSRVAVDQSIQHGVQQEVERLKAERNLRYFVDTTDISNSTAEEIDKLKELIDTARNKQVAENYLVVASDICEKMQGSLSAHQILVLLTDYPQREYPEPVPIDPKTKKPIVQKQEKPKTPAKKKKKVERFIYPE